MEKKGNEVSEYHREIIGEVDAFIENVEKGSLEYKALKDWGVLKLAEASLWTVQQHAVAESEKNGKTSIPTMSQLRLHESRVVNFEAKIEEKGTDDPDYYAAYGFLKTAWPELPIELKKSMLKEAKEKTQTDRSEPQYRIRKNPQSSS